MKKRKIAIVLTGVAILSAAMILSGCKSTTTTNTNTNTNTSEIVVVEPDSEVVTTPVSVDGIVGMWYEADALDPRTLIINGDGSFELDYKGGGAMYGTVEVTAEEHPDGSESYWYTFLDQEGEVWESFGVEDGVQTDLYSGQDGELHFVLADETEVNGGGQGLETDRFIGRWACDRCSIEIEELRNTRLMVDVIWGDGAASTYEWLYTCDYDAEFGMLTSNDGTKYHLEYDAEGNETRTTEYNGGVAKFTINDDGTLSWIDEQENSADDMAFEKIQ